MLAVAANIRFGGYGHVYDFTVLALAAAMLYALLCERLLAFLALFAVSAWTKETTILMTFALLRDCFSTAFLVGALPLTWWRRSASMRSHSWHCDGSFGTTTAGRSRLVPRATRMVPA